MSALVVLPSEGKSVQIGGLGVVFKLLGASTGGQFAVVEHPIAAGALADIMTKYGVQLDARR